MTDADLLDEVLEMDLDDRTRATFKDIQAKTVLRDKPLSREQRAFAEAIRDGTRYQPPETYVNAVSSGAVPRGREVELLVKDRPLKPPGRR